MKIISAIALVLFALSSISCVTIYNYPNQQAPQYILPDQEPQGSEHIRFKV